MYVNCLYLSGMFAKIKIDCAGMYIELYNSERKNNINNVIFKQSTPYTLIYKHDKQPNR